MTMWRTACLFFDSHSRRAASNAFFCQTNVLNPLMEENPLFWYL